MTRLDDNVTPARADLIARARERMRDEGRRGLRRQPPRPRQPAQIERRYVSELRGIARRYNDNVRNELFDALDGIVEEAGLVDGSRTDSWALILANSIAAIDAANSAVAEDSESMVRSVAAQLVDFSDEEINRALRATLGVSVPFANREDMIESWVATNVSYITNMKDEQRTRIGQIVNQSVRGGERPDAIRRQLQERFGMDERRARLIARDQVGSLNGEMTRERQQELGLKRFRWVSVGDGDRVRPDHQEWDGNVYDWSDPPEGVIPGQEIQCRCRAASLVDELIDELEADE